MKLLSNRGPLACLVPAALLLIISCTSDATHGSSSPQNSAAAHATPPSSVLDEVQVMSPEQALEAATRDIDEANVLDELADLEREIEDS